MRYIKQVSTGKTITDSTGANAWMIESETVSDDRMLEDCAAATGFDVSDLEIASEPDLSNVHKMPAPTPKPTPEEKASDAAAEIFKQMISKYGSLAAAEEALK